MEKEWKKYYSEMFRVYSSGIIADINGDSQDEWGKELDEMFEPELEEMEKAFGSFMYNFNKYNIELNRDVIAFELISFCDGLGVCNKPKEAWKYADMMILGNSRKIIYNDTQNPLGKP